MKSLLIAKQAVEAALDRYGQAKGPLWTAPKVSTSPQPNQKSKGIGVVITMYGAQFDIGHYALYRVTAQVDVVAYQAGQIPAAGEIAEFLSAYWARIGLPDQVVAGDLALHGVRHLSGPTFLRAPDPGAGAKYTADYEFICRRTPTHQAP